MTEPDDSMSNLPRHDSRDARAWQERAELERALLERLQATGKSRIPRRTTTGPCPASFAQSRLWYIDQLNPGVPLYNIQSAYRIRGPLDVAALQASVNAIVRRHQVLRTSFIAPDGQPLQVVAPDLTVPLSVVDLTAVPDAEAGRVQDLAREHVRRPFDLAQGPLLRLTLLCLAPEDHVLLLAMHHIVSDAWSMNVFAEELSTLYDAFAQGRPSPLLDLPIQYADFSLWQRSMLQGQALQDQLRFWKNHLAGAPPTLDLPTDRPPPAQPSYHGARLMPPLPSSLVDAVQMLSRQQRATPFMVFLAAFAIVLQRYTGQDDLVIGTPISNRTHTDTERLIGFFVNTLALHLDLSGNPSFRELLGRVREVALDAYEHQDLPFEKLVEELHPQRDVSRPPLFQVLFQVLNLPQAPLRLAGVTLQRFHVDSGVAPLDLTFSLSPGSKPPEMWVEYSKDLFDRATVQRLVLHYQTLLEAALARPDERIGHLPLLTPAEHQQMLVTWNRTEEIYPPQCLHQMFEQQVQRTPAALAVTFEGQRLTYTELNARANQLAHYLRRRGVGPESIVAIRVERSLDMPVGLLGILKAGGAYLPLDPGCPPERLAFILEQSGARLLLTQQSLPVVPHGATRATCETVYLDSVTTALHAESCENPPNLTAAENLAYVIYTSGSTGSPKGVMISHRAVCYHTAWYCEAFLRADDRALQVTALTFDASVPEVFATLVAGAQVILPAPQAEMDPAGLVEFMGREGVTILAAVPALLQAMVEDPGFPQCTCLRHILCGGEAMSTALEAQVRARTQATLYHCYGVTEDTIDSTNWRCGPAHGRLTPPIGRPIANTQAYVLDHHLQPVPPGVSGEICLAGAGLARGYLQDPALTAEKFVPNPWGETGTRLYRTGDLGRWTPHGDLECLGRLDRQIKLRGFRIELGEIEARLSEHPSVRRAVVTVQEALPAGRGLVAYVVPSSPQLPSASELRSYLSATLPAYMLPSAFVSLQFLPMTASGKVDHRALPLPSRDQVSPNAPFVAPRNATEETLAAIWMEILGLSTVGVHDGFFALGGHSLQATQIIARVRQEFGVELSLRTLFSAPTVAGLAAAIAAAPVTESAALDRIPRARRTTDSSAAPGER